MRLGQDRYAGDAAIGREAVEMDMQQRCARRRHALPQRRLDVLQIVEILRPDKIDEEMCARMVHAIALTEISCIRITRNANSAPYSTGSVCWLGRTP